MSGVTVQADHAPEAGVAQGIFHGILARHHGRIQEEVEEGLEEEVATHSVGYSRFAVSCTRNLLQQIKMI